MQCFIKYENCVFVPWIADLIVESLMIVPKSVYNLDRDLDNVSIYHAVLADNLLNQNQFRHRHCARHGTAKYQ